VPSAQVDFIVSTVQAEPDGAGSLAAVDVIDVESLHFLSHDTVWSALPGFNAANYAAKRSLPPAAKMSAVTTKVVSPAVPAAAEPVLGSRRHHLFLMVPQMAGCSRRRAFCRSSAVVPPQMPWIGGLA